MAKRRRDRELEAKWRSCVRRQAKSGLSIRAFCRRERISEPSFYAWRRELQKRDVELAGEYHAGEYHDDNLRVQSMDFAPVTVMPEACRPVDKSLDKPFHECGLGAHTVAAGLAGEIRIDLSGDRILRLPVSISPAWLAELVVGLEAGSLKVTSRETGSGIDAANAVVGGSA